MKGDNQPSRTIPQWRNLAVQIILGHEFDSGSAEDLNILFRELQGVGKVDEISRMAACYILGLLCREQAAEPAPAAPALTPQEVANRSWRHTATQALAGEWDGAPLALLRGMKLNFEVTDDPVCKAAAAYVAKLIGEE